MSKRKSVKSSYQPSIKKTVHIAENVDGLRQLSFKWRVDDKYIDYDHEEWGWGKVTIQKFFKELLHRLQDYETMTWDEILRRPSCHDIEASELCGEAQSRLQEMHLDIDTLHQLKITQKCRLWGYRDRQDLYLIWHDPHHTVNPV